MEKMVYTKYGVILILCFFTYLTKAQSPAEAKGSVVIENVKLEEMGDSLLLEFTIEVKKQAINYRQDWHIVPEMTNNEMTMFFPSVLINGRQKERHFQRKERFDNKWLRENYPSYKTFISKKGTQELIQYQATIPYQSWMQEATLTINYYLGSSRAQLQLLSSDSYGCLELKSSKLYNVQPRVNYIIPEKEEKRKTIQACAFLDFPMGISKIQPDYRRNPLELEEIRNNIYKVLNNDNLSIDKIYIEGYASPEGSYELNKRLSKERAEALKNYLIEQFGIEKESFRVSSIAEDWDGFRTLIEDREIQDKEKILEIINSKESADVKEKKLRSLGSSWRLLLNQIFPLLRRTEYRIDFTIIDFTSDKSKDLIKQDLLSLLEYFQLAMSYEETDKQRLEVLEKAVHKYPDSPIALSNYVAALLANKEINTAGRYLEKIKDTPEAYNNMGVYLLLTGDTDAAQKYFERAKSAGIPEAEHNLKELNIYNE